MNGVVAISPIVSTIDVTHFVGLSCCTAGEGTEADVTRGGVKPNIASPSTRVVVAAGASVNIVVVVERAGLVRCTSSSGFGVHPPSMHALGNNSNADDDSVTNDIEEFTEER